MHGEEVTGITSRGFSEYTRFHDCLKRDSAHIMRGGKGEYVKRLQHMLDSLIYFAYIESAEGWSHDATVRNTLAWKDNYPGAFSGDGDYGLQTAKMVSVYKDLMKIKGKGQAQPDQIVGVMTMKSMEKHALRLDRFVDEHGHLPTPR